MHTYYSKYMVSIYYESLSILRLLTVIHSVKPQYIQYLIHSIPGYIDTHRIYERCPQIHIHSRTPTVCSHRIYSCSAQYIQVSIIDYTVGCIRWVYIFYTVDNLVTHRIHECYPQYISTGYTLHRIFLALHSVYPPDM